MAEGHVVRLTTHLHLRRHSSDRTGAEQLIVDDDHPRAVAVLGRKSAAGSGSIGQYRLATRTDGAMVSDHLRYPAHGAVRTNHASAAAGHPEWIDGQAVRSGGRRRVAKSPARGPGRTDATGPAHLCEDRDHGGFGPIHRVDRRLPGPRQQRAQVVGQDRITER